MQVPDPYHTPMHMQMQASIWNLLRPTEIRCIHASCTLHLRQTEYRTQCTSLPSTACETLSFPSPFLESVSQSSPALPAPPHATRKIRSITEKTLRAVLVGCTLTFMKAFISALEDRRNTIQASHETKKSLTDCTLSNLHDMNLMW